MCGIAGVFAPSGSLAPDVEAAVDRMTDALAHRGPDGRGVWIGDGVVLGHRRLSIIDVAHGAQPMSTDDGQCWIVFNGEVYNHRRLRRTLEGRGCRFRTQSDTEAILHAYSTWGTACLDHLEGMFAFAIYDRRSRSLFVARDRLGKKPLYYAVFDGQFHFASEIKAMAQSPAWDPALDLSALESYFALGYVMAPQTAYRHVRMLPPAHALHLEGDDLRTWRYWEVTDFDSDDRSAEVLAADLDALLRDCVGDRLESEVPLGAFLSGGIDSGLVVSYMAEAMERPVETTAVGFDDAGHNELDAAALTAQRYHTHHHAEVARLRLDEALDSIVEAFDQPFADASAIPTHYVSALARRHVTVALSGDGGDEVFAGYDFRYVPHVLESRVRAWLPSGLGPTMTWLGHRWPRGRGLPRPLRLATLLENLGVDAPTAYYRDLCFLKPERVARLLGRAPGDTRDSALAELVTSAYRRCPSSNALQCAQFADVQTYLPNDVLVKVDRMSMRHGLEVRTPLLDRRLVEFGFRIPASRKMPGLRAKALLKRLAVSRLPAALLDLPKHGFTAPVATWLAGPYADAFADEVLRADSFVSTVVDPAYLREVFDRHRQGREDQSYTLWAAWVLERWARSTRRRPCPSS